MSEYNYEDMVQEGCFLHHTPRTGTKTKNASNESCKTKNDPVNRPAHYTQGGIECIDAIRAALTPEEFRGFCKGNVLKYAWRERHKGGDESLKKAAWYLKRATEAGKC